MCFAIVTSELKNGLGASGTEGGASSSSSSPSAANATLEAAYRDAMELIKAKDWNGAFVVVCVFLCTKSVTEDACFFVTLCWFSCSFFFFSFFQVLRAQNVGLLTRVCSTLTARELLNPSSLQLSQEIILSLLQQMAFNLHAQDEKLAVRLSWMLNAAQAIDPSHASVSLLS